MMSVYLCVWIEDLCYYYNCFDTVWIDAKINSIQRKPHNSECSCQYYVNLYVNQGSLGTEIRTLSKEVKVVGINEIAILQKLERSDATSSSLNIDSHIIVVNFKVDKEGTLVPIVAQVDVSDTNRSGHAHDSHHDEVSPSYDVEGLRRSKRRNIQPERYFGCGNVSEMKVGNVRTWPYKLNKRKDDEESLSGLQDKRKDDEESLSGLQDKCIEEHGDNSQKANEVSSCREIIVYSNKTKDVKSGEANQTQHATVPLLEEGGSLALEHHPLNDKVTRSNAHYSSTPKLPRKRLLDLEDDVDFDPKWEGINSNKGVRGKRHRSWY
ncbi:SNF2 domain-containing protein CLASSY 2, partial [Mucuna pruriens]